MEDLYGGNKDLLIQITLLGDVKVGKSSIVQTYLEKPFFERYEPTIEDMYRKCIQIKNKTVFLNILDTSGCNEFGTMLDLYIQKTDGFIFVCSPDNNNSLAKLEEIYQKIMNIKEINDGSNLSLFLCRNKSDIEPRYSTISNEQCRKFALEHHCEYFTTSAKTRENIELLFESVINDCYKKKYLTKFTPKSTKGKKKKCTIL